MTWKNQYGPTQWTEERVALMLRLVAEGKSGGAMGKELSTTRNAVIGKLYRMGLKLAPNNGVPVKTAKKPLRVRRRLNMYRLGEIRTRPVLRYKPPKSNVTRMRPPMKPKRPANQCTIMELNNHTCRWPLWKADSDPRLYCGAETNRRVYCEEHRQQSSPIRNNAHEYVRRDPARDFVINRRPAKSPKSIVV